MLDIENGFVRTTSNHRQLGAFTFEGLLDDPAIGSWAREAAAERQVTPLDALALLDHLGIQKCRAIGLSFGANTLLHMATMQPDRIEAMVLVSATTYFPEQARAIMRQVPAPDQQPTREWEAMRKAAE